MERSRDWIRQAEHDLIKGDMQAGFYDWACFSAQQAAGKAVKAAFYRMNAEAWGTQLLICLMNYLILMKYLKSLLTML